MDAVHVSHSHLPGTLGFPWDPHTPPTPRQGNGSSEKVGDLSEARLLHACCVLRSLLTASHVVLRDQVAKVTQHPHVPMMPGAEPALSINSLDGLRD